MFLKYGIVSIRLFPTLIDHVLLHDLSLCVVAKNCCTLTRKKKEIKKNNNNTRHVQTYTSIHVFICTCFVFSKTRGNNFGFL
jgi:hypothetical protein